VLTATPAGENGKKGAFQPQSPPRVSTFQFILEFSRIGEHITIFDILPATSENIIKEC
jgi:hypothetical protein